LQPVSRALSRHASSRYRLARYRLALRGKNGKVSIKFPLFLLSQRRGEERYPLPTSVKNSTLRHPSTKPAIETNEYGVISLLKLIAGGRA
jgi:hypothetical protein